MNYRDAINKIETYNRSVGFIYDCKDDDLRYELIFITAIPLEGRHYGYFKIDDPEYSQKIMYLDLQLVFIFRVADLGHEMFAEMESVFLDRYIFRN